MCRPSPPFPHRVLTARQPFTHPHNLIRTNILGPSFDPVYLLRSCESFELVCRNDARQLILFFRLIRYTGIVPRLPLTTDQINASSLFGTLQTSNRKSLQLTPISCLRSRRLHTDTSPISDLKNYSTD